MNVGLMCVAKTVKKLHLMCQYLEYTITPSDKIDERVRIMKQKHTTTFLSRIIHQRLWSSNKHIFRFCNEQIYST
jgi:hypothetical protein